jgi:purine-binding chemotaxis protein CheW
MASQPNNRVVICQVGDHRFALEVTAVREVCTGVGLVRVPGVAAPVEGVANVRGTLVTIVRGAELLGVAGGSREASPWLVVLRARGGRVGIGVDEVLDLETGVAGDLVRFDVDSAIDAVFGRAT